MTPDRPLEALFADYRRDGDPAAWAELFDRAAPELLRVACHVARDLPSAEDLVQQTFLTALEAAESFDARRRVVPWLLGILANHARAARRRSARQLEWSELPGRSLESRADAVPKAAHLRELDSRIERELAQLAEPYREVARRALRRDEKPAQIALALGRAPGTVRVQLHRALELLRQRLPRGAALGAWCGPALQRELGRGLAAVKAVVNAHALARAGGVAGAAAGGGVALGAALSIGSVVMAKKVAIGALLLAAAAGAWWWSDGARPPPPHAADESSASRSAAERATAEASARAAATGELALPIAQRDAEPLAADSAPPAAAIIATQKGEVVDARDGAPLPGAAVTFFPPLALTLTEVARRFSSYAIGATRVGELAFRGPWPRFVEPLSPTAWPDRALVLLCAPPEFGAPPPRPLARGATDEAGRFALPLSLPHGVLVIEHAGFERQVVPLLEPGTTELSIALQQARPLVGRLVDASGAPVRERIELLFVAIDRAGFAHQVAQSKEARQALAAGPWLATTDAEGRFELAIGAAQVVATSVTPGIRVAEAVRVLPHNGMQLRAPRRLTPGGGPNEPPIELAVEQRPVLAVVDDASGAPQEEFSLFAIASTTGHPALHGLFHAKGGRLELPTGRPASGVMDPLREPLRVQLWTAHHAPASLELPAGDARGDVEVRLLGGAPLELHGTVTRDGQPQPAAIVTLNGHGPQLWTPEELARLSVAVTDRQGRFTLAGPPGRFLLGVEAPSAPAGAPNFLTRVELPAGAPLAIELSATARLEVVVRDPGGAPCAEALVHYRSSDGRQGTASSDASGQVAFAALAPGDYVVSLFGIGGRRVATAQDQATVALLAGKTLALELMAPPDGPRTLQVRGDGLADFTGWRARQGLYDEEPWSALAADGTIATDVAGWTQLEVESPAQQRWKLRLSPRVLASGAVVLPISAVGYRGRVVDRASGQPIAGAIVRAGPRDPLDDSGREQRCVADAEGRFELLHLEATLHVVLVERPGAARGGMVPTFEATQPATAGGRELLLRLPSGGATGGAADGALLRRFEGRLTRAASGAPLSDATLFCAARWRDDDGAWTVAHAGAFAHSSPDGDYAVVALRAPEYFVWVREAGQVTGLPSLITTWSDGGGGEELERRDVTIE